MLGALVIPFQHGMRRHVLVLGLPIVAMYYAWSLPEGNLMTATMMGLELTPVRVDAMSRIFATIFTLMTFVGSLFAMRQERSLELGAAFLYGGSAVGVVFAGDLLTVFIFWELMTIGSTTILWSTGKEKAYKAAMRYFRMHLLGGVLLMAGIAGYVGSGNPIAFNAMELGSISTWLILIGFLINAGAPPFSSWLPDAYPEASFSGTVFLSACTTKTAVYVLMRGFPGTEILIYFGVYMIFYGIIYALLENDMRRILAYSIINQVGFMVTGIGIGTEMAINGAAAHAFAHIIYKALLMMSAGAVIYRTNKHKCTDLGGLFQSMPITAISGIIGALAISAFPFTSGFVSKSMINQAAADQHLMWVWFCLAAASAGVFLHAGIKFPWFVFFQKDSGMRPKDPPWNMNAAMIIFSFFCIFLGVYPDPLYALLPYPVAYVPYTVTHVVNMLQLLLFSGLAFFLLLPMMKRTLTISLDYDWFTRIMAPWVASAVGAAIASLRSDIFGAILGNLDKRIAYWTREHKAWGTLNRPQYAHTSVIVVLVMFAVCLGFFFVQV